jgi:hypothetical protein
VLPSPQIRRRHTPDPRLADIVGHVRLPDTLRAVVQEQRGLVTTRQLLAAGVTRDAIRWAVGRSARVVLPGVIALFTGPLDAQQHVIAARLFTGEKGMLASLSAAHWHGLVDTHDGVIRMQVPAGHEARRSGFVSVTRTRRPDPRPWSRGPLLICSPARALADAAREMRDARAVEAMVISAVQRGVVRAEDLQHEIEAGPVRGSARARAGLRAALSGAWSSPEVDMLDVLGSSSTLPKVWPNPVLTTADGRRLPSPDGWIDEVGLAIQVHSRKHHAGDEDWERTVEGDGALGEVGVHVIGVTPRSLRQHPGRFLERAERTYLSLLRTGRRPDVVMRPRGPGLVGVGVGAIRRV